MTRSKHSFLSIVTACLIAGVTFIFSNEEVRAEPSMPDSGNVQFNYPNRRPTIQGEWYWHSSRAREWLHSDEASPSFTNPGSVTRQTRGFLSGFTVEEYEQIAVTRRKAFIHGSYHSRSRNGPPQLGSRTHSGNDAYSSMNLQFMHYFSNPVQLYDNVLHVVAHDKVFLFNPAEWQQYVQLRGVDPVRTTHGSGYFISGTQTYTGNVSRGQYVDSGGIHRQAGGAGTTSRGMVPALHLKPDSPTAQGLSIGDTVTFGRYTSDNGVFSGPIEWDVVNITDGHPLLWAKESVETIPYNVNPNNVDENQAYAYSDYIAYDEYDIDITDDLKYHNPHGSHIDPPRIWLVNTDDHQNRRIDSWDAVMKAESPVGISWMEAPDGTRVYGDTISYRVTRNDMGGRYAFRLMDNHHNYHGTHLPVGNIDAEVEVDILFDMPDTGWTNQPVTTTIQLSNQAIHGTGFGGRVSGGWTPFRPPSFTTYTNTRYHAKGEVRLVVPNDAESVRHTGYASATFSSNLTQPSWLNGEYAATNNYSMERIFTIGELMDAGVGEWVEWEYTRQITGDFLRFIGGIGVHRQYNAETMAITAPVIEFRNVDFTLLDTDRFELEHIQLPNGDMVYDPPAVFTDVIYDAGHFTYEVLDSRGYTWRESVDIQIDTTLPTITITESD